MSGYTGGCAPCGVNVFGSIDEARAHSESPEHKQKIEETREANGRRAASFDDKHVHRSRAVPAPAKRGPRIEEGRPWELFNSDGSLNIASYAYGAVVGFVELAHDQVSHRVADVQGETGEQPEFTLGQVEALAEQLLAAADGAQASNRQDGRVDRMDVSHTRARGAVRTALRVYPVPWGGDDDVRKDWLENLTAHAAALMRVSFDLFRQHEQGDGE